MDQLLESSSPSPSATTTLDTFGTNSVSASRGSAGRVYSLKKARRRDSALKVNRYLLPLSDDEDEAVPSSTRKQPPKSRTGPRTSLPAAAQSDAQDDVSPSKQKTRRSARHSSNAATTVDSDVDMENLNTSPKVNGKGNGKQKAVERKRSTRRHSQPQPEANPDTDAEMGQEQEVEVHTSRRSGPLSQPGTSASVTSARAPEDSAARQSTGKASGRLSKADGPGSHEQEAIVISSSEDEVSLPNFSVSKKVRRGLPPPPVVEIRRRVRRAPKTEDEEVGHVVEDGRDDAEEEMAEDAVVDELIMEEDLPKKKTKAPSRRRSGRLSSSKVGNMEIDLDDASGVVPPLSQADTQADEQIGIHSLDDEDLLLDRDLPPTPVVEIRRRVRRAPEAQYAEGRVDGEDVDVDVDVAEEEGLPKKKTKGRRRSGRLSSSKQGAEDMVVDLDAEEAPGAIPPSSPSPLGTENGTQADERVGADEEYSMGDEDLPLDGEYNGGNEDLLLDGEIIGDEDLLLDGESPPELNADGEFDISMRIMEDFAIMSAETGEYVDFMDLLDCAESSDGDLTQFHARGVVKTKLTRGNHDERDEPTRVRLTILTQVNTHWFYGDTKEWDEDIYLCTDSAWYTLRHPAKAYLKSCHQFWLKHRALHLALVKGLQDPDLSYDDFIAYLFPPQGNSKIRALGYTLKKEEFGEHVEPHIAENFLYEWRQTGVSVKPVFIVEMRRRLQETGVQLELVRESEEDSEDQSIAATSTTSKRRSTKSSKNKTKEKPKPTIVTPIVASVSNLFNATALSSNLQAVGEKVLRDHGQVLDSVKMHEGDPTSIELKEEQYFDEATGRRYYAELVLDGVSYTVGDFVTVAPGDDPDEDRGENDKAEKSQCRIELVNKSWFGQIMYFYETAEGEVMFHQTWLCHGSRTLMQEVAVPMELFELCSQCDDSPVASIFCRINVERVHRDVDPLAHTSDLPPGTFYNRFVYEEVGLSCVDTASQEEAVALLAWHAEHHSLAQHVSCYSCAKKDKTADSFISKPILADGECIGLQYCSLQMHTGDFVLLRSGRGKKVGDGPVFKPTMSSTPPTLDIGQIVEVEEKKKVDALGHMYRVKVRMMDRRDRQDNRLLEYTDAYAWYDVSAIDGLCWVSCFAPMDEEDTTRLEAWTKEEEHFFVHPSKDWNCCVLCLVERQRHCEGMRKIDPLTTLELFAGAGGLSSGMEGVGATRTIAAVEFNPSAAEAWRANHPEGVMHCVDVNDFLAAVVEAEKNGTRPILNGAELPGKNDIRLITGGPPCQSFSRANTHKTKDDIRSTLPCAFLSLVEHYRPDYVALENVAGLLHHYEEDEASGVKVKHAMVKYIYVALVALGYQVRYAVPNAIQYGAPQARNRVIFLAARCGIPLPNIPEPTHSHPKPLDHSTPIEKYQLPRVSRSLLRDYPNLEQKIHYDDQFHIEGPHAYVTIDDTISDLPKWEWKFPDPTPELKAEMHARQKQGITQFDAVYKGSPWHTGYGNAVAYRCDPETRYQRWLRGGASQVTYHYNPRYRSRVVKRVVHIPLKPDSYCIHLPENIKADLPPGIIKRMAKQIFYGRKADDQWFHTITTTLRPGERNTCNLHPSQRRVYTVREIARAQGFPDDFVLKSVETNESAQFSSYVRQIGNAVPIPLAMALGRSFLIVEMKRYALLERSGSEREGSLDSRKEDELRSERARSEEKESVRSLEV